MLETLPRLHPDPFDRLLAAALAEPHRLITADARLAAYGPPVTLV
jgi:PIN domain nuclease of toxin-antitoxin system